MRSQTGSQLAIAAMSALPVSGESGSAKSVIILPEFCNRVARLRFGWESLEIGDRVLGYPHFHLGKRDS